MQIVWAIIVGAPDGLRSPNNPQGFVLTTVLGIVGSVVATFLGRAIHLYDPNQGAEIIASIIGALIVLWGWHQMARNCSMPERLNRRAGSRCCNYITSDHRSLAFYRRPYLRKPAHGHRRSF